MVLPKGSISDLRIIIFDFSSKDVFLFEGGKFVRYSFRGKRREQDNEPL